MKNLNLLEQEALEILKQLEFGCAQFELGGGGKENGSAKGVEIPVNNIELIPLLQKPGGLDAVERFLQSNGLNFSTNLDIIKRPFKFPDGTITEKTVFGIIKGENIQNIKTKIEELINELAPELEEKKKDEFRITKIGDDFWYKGDLRTLSKNNDWYKVFRSLYDLIPCGGEIPYTKLGEQIKSKIKKTKRYDTKEIRKFIQTNLTDKSNGFMRYAKILANEDNGKPLLYVNRDKGIVFNNKLG